MTLFTRLALARLSSRGMATLGMLLVALPANAQVAAANPPPGSTSAKQAPDAGDTLAAALAALPGEQRGARLLIALSPEDKKRSAVSSAFPAAPPVSGPLGAICLQYRRTFDRFGEIGALPPATMTVLRLPEAPKLSPNSVSLETALKVFLSMLTVDQLKQMGGDGLDLGSLSPDQRDFFRNIVARPLPVASNTGPDPFQSDPPLTNSAPVFRAFRAGVQGLPASAMQSATRLRAALCASYSFTRPEDSGTLSVETKSKDVRAQSDYSRSFMTPPAFHVANPNPILSAIKSTVPTILKSGELDWGRSELRGVMAPAAFKTVGEIVIAVGRRSSLELYCDPHYADKTLAFYGDVNREYPISDLLRVLTVSVCGAWRKVGPAYVLTNDVLGVGYRRQAIHDALTPWAAHIDDLNTDADAALAQKKLPQLLHFRPDDPLAAPLDSIRGELNEEDMVETKFGRLPSALQEELRARLHKETLGVPEKSDDPDDTQPFLRADANRLVQGVNNDFSVQVSPGIQLILDIPNFGSLSLATTSSQHTLPLNNPDREPASSDLETPPRINPARNIALMAAPASETEARALVDQMAQSGMKTLYCMAFTNGMTYFPSSAIPPTSAHGGVLAAAVDEGKLKGVAVHATLDLMQWNTDTPKVDSFDWSHSIAPEITIVGKTPSAALDTALPHTMEEHSDEMHALVRAMQSGGWPSVLDPHTRQILVELCRETASIPGISGVFFSRQCPPGYGGVSVISEVNPVDLGYGDAMRLAYLRAHHQDPIDIAQPDSGVNLDKHGQTTVMLSSRLFIPEYDDFADSNYLLAWDDFRTKIWGHVMADVFAAVKKTAPGLSLSVRDYIGGLSFYPWTDPAVNPIMPSGDSPESDVPRAIIAVGAFDDDKALAAMVQEAFADDALDTIIFDTSSIPIRRDLLDEVKALSQTFDFKKVSGAVDAGVRK
ncbi:MAG: hypothetical protein ABIY70_28255 [Capsulimonas sp.]|uniref:hypothetical protein n=1 Tax=Capsulimonas sp. TaxID=2494211 RepID=UPI003266D0D3